MWNEKTESLLIQVTHYKVTTWIKQKIKIFFVSGVYIFQCGRNLRKKQHCNNIFNFTSLKFKWHNECKTWIIDIKILEYICLSKTSKLKSLNNPLSPLVLLICPLLEKNMWIIWIMLTIAEYFHLDLELLSESQLDLLVYLRVRLNKPSQFNVLSCISYQTPSTYYLD